jgi:hypothetical protein
MSVTPGPVALHFNHLWSLLTDIKQMGDLNSIATVQTHLLTDMFGLFSAVNNNPIPDFNVDLSSWNTANVKDFSQMFKFQESFDQNIGTWDTSRAENLKDMFDGASAFNQNIASWNTIKVESFEFMFQNAIAFNQDISSWCTLAAQQESAYTSMFLGATANNAPGGGANCAMAEDEGEDFKILCGID